MVPLVASITMEEQMRKPTEFKNEAAGL